MKLSLLVLLCLSLTATLSAQQIDTIKYYQVSGHLRFGILDKDTTCTLDGKPFPISEYLRIEAVNDRLDRHPYPKDSIGVFFVKNYDLEERLLFSAYQTSSEPIFFGDYKDYYPNGQLKTEGQYMFFGSDWKQYEKIRHWNNKTGNWKYYRPDGRLRRQKRFKNGHRKLI